MNTLTSLSEFCPVCLSASSWTLCALTASPAKRKTMTATEINCLIIAPQGPGSAFVRMDSVRRVPIQIELKMLIAHFGNRIFPAVE